MNKILILIMIVVLLAGCGSKKHVPVVVTATDSIRQTITRTITEKEIVLPPDSALIRALLACDSLGNVYLKTIKTLQGERVRQSIQLEGNILKATATDQARERHYTQQTGETLIRYREIPVTVPVTVEVNRLSSWQAFQIWMGRIALILMILFAGWRIFKAKLNNIIKPFKP